MFRFPLRRLVRVALVGALVAAGALALRRIDRHALAAGLAQASLAPILAAALLNLVGRTAARTRRTQVLLHGLSEGRVRFTELFQLLLGGYAASTLLPGPAEEVLCTTALVRRGFRLRDLLGTQALEKALGVLSIVTIAVPVVPVRGPLLFGAAAAFAVVAVLVVRRRRSGQQRRRVAEALGWLLVSNVLNVAMVALCASAVGLHLGLGRCLQLFVMTTTLTNALPLLPAQVGILESAFVLSATRLGVDPGAALVTALLYHFAQVAPLTLAGLPTLIRFTRDASRSPCRA
jgi:hypothetical protein